MIADALTSAAGEDALTVLRGCFHGLYSPYAAPAACSSVLLLGAATPGLAELLMEMNGGAGPGRLVVVEPELERHAVAEPSSPTAGQPNARFVRAALDDLQTNPTAADRLISSAKPLDAASYDALRTQIDAAARAAPLLADESFDAVVVDLSVNRLDASAAEACCSEAFRVLKRGGKMLVTAILADMAAESIAGAGVIAGPWVNVPLETALGALLERAGFHGVSYVWASPAPTVGPDGAHLRYFIVEAFKGKQGMCLDQGHAVIFKGPWKQVWDDDGHRYVRGERTAVCEKTFRLLTQEPYGAYFIGLPSAAAPDLTEAPLFDCTTPRLRNPRVTRGETPVDSQVSEDATS